MTTSLYQVMSPASAYTRMAEAIAKVSTVVPLKGTNYSTWKVQCRMALMKEGLWNIVTKKEVALRDETSQEYATYIHE